MTPQLSRMFTPLLLVLAMTTFLGCAHDHAARSTAATSQPATLPHAPPPIRYADYAHPNPLIPAQLAELTTLAAELRPAGRDVWFILVLSNYVEAEHPSYRAVIYFTPDTATDRLRTGQCSHIDAAIPVTQRRALIKRIDPNDTYPRLSGYVQVSPAGTPFKPDDTSLPDNANLPFSRPEHMSDADLVAVIDAARQVDRTHEPVLRIGGDGLFQVTFGWQVGGLSGGGTVVTVRRTPAGYQADRTITYWVS